MVHFVDPLLIYGYGSIPINTIFNGMNIHLPAILMFILMFTRGIGFWPIPIYINCMVLLVRNFHCISWCIDGLQWCQENDRLKREVMALKDLLSFDQPLGVKHCLYLFVSAHLDLSIYIYIISISASGCLSISISISMFAHAPTYKSGKLRESAVTQGFLRCVYFWGKGFSDFRSLFVSGMINIQRTPTNQLGSAKSIVQELHQKEKSNLEAQVTVEQDVLVGNWSGTHVRGFFSWYKCYIMLYIYIHTHTYCICRGVNCSFYRTLSFTITFELELIPWCQPPPTSCSRSKVRDLWRNWRCGGSNGRAPKDIRLTRSWWI